jgi:cupin domain
MRVIRQDELPFSNIAHELVGADHGIEGISVILVEAPPGSSVRLHRHDYDEVIIVQGGRGRFTAGDEEVELGAGSRRDSARLPQRWDRDAAAGGHPREQPIRDRMAGAGSLIGAATCGMR